MTQHTDFKESSQLGWYTCPKCEHGPMQESDLVVIYRSNSNLQGYPELEWLEVSCPECLFSAKWPCRDDSDGSRVPLDFFAQKEQEQAKERAKAKFASEAEIEIEKAKAAEYKAERDAIVERVYGERVVK